MLNKFTHIALVLGLDIDKVKQLSIFTQIEPFKFFYNIIKSV